MKVGVLGSGDVAKTLGSGFLKHGHDVTMGTRAPAKLADWTKQNPKGRIGSFVDAAKFGDLVVLAVKGTAALDALRAASATNLAGKPVIDATNPIAEALPTNGVLKFFTNLDESLMERLQREFGDVRFVKAFNSVGNACMVNPQFGGGKPTMFICGDDEGAKTIVSGVLTQFGWETADMGKAEAARAIEPLCMLWCIPGFLRNDWVHAFKTAQLSINSEPNNLFELTPCYPAACLLSLPDDAAGVLAPVHAQCDDRGARRHTFLRLQGACHEEIAGFWIGCSTGC